MFAHGGQTGDEMRAFDWSAHPLGLPADWDPLLLTLVNTLLSSAEPEYLVWGDEMWFFSNDAYRPILGSRVTNAIGATLPSLWPDAWPTVRPLAEQAFAGKASRVEDFLVPMIISGQPQDTWWTFSYSPVRDHLGQTVGFRCVTTERTDAIVNANRLKSSETHWQTLFTTLQEALMVGEAVTGPSGRIEDLRVLEFNPAWRRLVGDPQGLASGVTMTELFGEPERFWIDLAAQVIDTGTALALTRQIGRQGKWYDCVAQPLNDNLFVLVFSDVTERVRADQQQVDQERRRRLAMEIGDVGLWDIDLATGAVDWDRKMQALFGSRDARTPTRSDMCKAIHPDDRAEFVRQFDSACDNAAVLDMKFRVIGLDDGVERWVSMKGIVVRENDAPIRFVGAARDITWQVLNEKRRTTLNQELAHRLKNTLAVVSAIVSQTLREAEDLESGRKSTMDRIRALSSAHDVVMSGHQNAASVRSIVEAALMVHGQSNHIEVDGPEIMMGSRAALSLSLIVHELATNAGKYGALSVPEGRVSLSWAVRADDPARATLEINWVERGGPPVDMPEHTGFGTELLNMGLSESGSGGVEITYDPAGLRCALTAALSDVQRLDDHAEDG